MRREDLTDTQRRVLDAIADAYLEHGQLLGAAELAATLRVGVADIQKALDDLERFGMLSKQSHTRPS